MTLQLLFEKNDIPPGLLARLAQPPFMCTNIGHFSTLFEKKEDIEAKLWPLLDAAKAEEKELVENKMCWAGRIRGIWKTCVNLEDKASESMLNSLENVDTEAPLPADQAADLESTFKGK